jgi:diguanylate cyclase (GGDEF)-like protein/PAS domain S-box-containing protein
VYYFAIDRLLPIIGPVSSAIAVVPSIALSWRFGRWRGVILTAYVLLLTIIPFVTQNVSGEIVAYIVGGGTTIMIAYLVGWIKESLHQYILQSRELREEKDRLEFQNMELEQLKHELTVSENRFRTLFELAPDPYFILDLEGIFVEGNQAVELTFGSPRTEFIGKNLGQISLSEELHQQISEHLTKCMIGQNVSSIEYDFFKQDGTRIPIELQLQAVTLQDELVILGTARDISVRKSAEEMLHQMNVELEEVVAHRTEALLESQAQLEHDALHDALTGLPNRTLLTNRIDLSIDQEKRHQDYHFALLFLDVDHFKVINDSLGHLIGDQILISISKRLNNCMREVDTVARIGGDEFVILLAHIESVNDVVQIVKRITDDLSEPHRILDHEIYVTVSIGITISTTGYSSPDEILRDADIALYRAKDNGRSRYELFDHTMHKQAQWRLQLEMDMHKALQENEFSVHYQPIMDITQDRLAGFEALARWEHPSLGFIPPDDFISLAEETGLIIPLGYKLIYEACAQCCFIQEAYQDKSLKISINISGKHIIQPNFVEELDRILVTTGLDPKTLIIEITEGVLIDNTSLVKSTLEELIKRGISIHLDDFGTGYSSLSYLHQFPFHSIKIDRSFINMITPASKKNEIVEAIINLANGLGKKVIAEGVETDDQLRYLKSLSCQMAQGYFFSRPVSAKEL